jgi:hypothetical protein
MRIVLEIRATGDFTDQELKDFVEFELQGGSLDGSNPFVLDESAAQITRVDVD